jgi:hypothetical protein
MRGWDWVHLVVLVATSGPTVPPPDDWWVWSVWWNENWQGKPKWSEKTWTNTTLSISIPTWPDLWSNPGLRDGKPATNRLNAIRRSWIFTPKHSYHCFSIGPNNLQHTLRWTQQLKRVFTLKASSKWKPILTANSCRKNKNFKAQPTTHDFMIICLDNLQCCVAWN